MAEKYGEWNEGSQAQDQTLIWQEEARARLERIPPFIRGMVMKEVESRAITQGLDTVSSGFMEESSSNWESNMRFHSDSDN